MILDSIVEDRLRAQTKASESEQLNLDQRQVELLSHPEKLSAEADQRIEALQAEIRKLESHLLENLWDDQAIQDSQDRKSFEQLILDNRQLEQLRLQPAEKLSADTKQRIEALEAEVQKIESQFARHVAGLGQARHALGVRLEQVQAAVPNDGAL